MKIYLSGYINALFFSSHSGMHRPLGPKYGEYVFVPPQRWLNSMAAGAIIMLYHPCANPAQVKITLTVPKLLIRSLSQIFCFSPHSGGPPQEPRHQMSTPTHNHGLCTAHR